MRKISKDSKSYEILSFQYVNKFSNIALWKEYCKKGTLPYKLINCKSTCKFSRFKKNLKKRQLMFQNTNLRIEKPSELLPFSFGTQWISEWIDLLSFVTTKLYCSTPHVRKRAEVSWTFLKIYTSETFLNLRWFHNSNWYCKFAYTNVIWFKVTYVSTSAYFIRKVEVVVTI